VSLIELSVSSNVARVTLNRPEVRNAFNEALIEELTEWATGAADAKELRAAVLQGAGSMFCAGADLDWMSRMIRASPEENVRDATAMTRLFGALDALPFPLVGRVHGAALGGGAGLAAVCDIVVAADAAVFGFTEVKLGILPAVIAPFTIAKIGVSAARELFLTGARFSAARAREIGLVHTVVEAAALDDTVDETLATLASSAPSAVAAAKALIRHVAWRSPAEVAGFTADTIARQRISDEGQEGMRAFLEKRKPAWTRL
jgi:methylglutaconyl-CoA hydratase